jgi:uncharacterized membrane protein YhaH (DUF805 family)
MDVDRLSTGEKMAGASAVLLFIFMFFEWFSVDIDGGSGFFDLGGGNAWEALSVIPIVLLLAIVAAIAVVVIRLTDALFEPPVSINAVAAVLGAISVLLILYRIVDPPGGGDAAGASIDVSPSIGIFLGLIAAAGLAYGAYRAMQEEGVSFGDVGDRLSSGGSRGGSGGSDPGPGHAHGAGPQQPPASSPPPPPPPPPPAGQGGPPPAQ